MCWPLTHAYLSIVQPKWEFLLPPLVPGGTLTPLLTPTQKTHSAGSVPRGWLPGINTAHINTTHKGRTIYDNKTYWLLWTVFISNPSSAKIKLTINWPFLILQVKWMNAISPDSLRTSGLATVTAAVKSLPLYSVSNCQVTNWDCWVYIATRIKENKNKLFVILSYSTLSIKCQRIQKE